MSVIILKGLKATVQLILFYYFKNAFKSKEKGRFDEDKHEAMTWACQSPSYAEVCF